MHIYLWRIEDYNARFHSLIEGDRRCKFNVPGSIVHKIVHEKFGHRKTLSHCISEQLNDKCMRINFQILERNRDNRVFFFFLAHLIKDEGIWVLHINPKKNVGSMICKNLLPTKDLKKNSQIRFMIDLKLSVAWHKSLHIWTPKNSPL